MQPHPEDMLAVTGRCSREQAREALTAENVNRVLYGCEPEGMDDMGEHAMEHFESLRAGRASATLARRAEAENARRIAESGDHFRFGEMACTSGIDAPTELPWYTPHGVMAAASVGFVSVCVFLGYHVLPLIA